MMKSVLYLLVVFMLSHANIAKIQSDIMQICKNMSWRRPTGKRDNPVHAPTVNKTRIIDDRRGYDFTKIINDVRTM